MPRKQGRHLVAVLSLLILLAAAPWGLGDDPGQKAKKDGKQANPLQALQDAFSKGVTLSPIDPKELPKAIADAAAKNAPGAAVKKAQKQEIRHTMKYVALDKPKVQWYQAVVVKDGERFRVRLAADGKKLGSKKEAPKQAKGKKDAPAEDKKEIEIPAKAAKAVKAIKELYPDAVVKEITTEVYQDPSGIVEVLTYEVEFITKGTKREMVASPEGVIPHLVKPVAVKDLPKAVADTLAKEVPGGKVEKAVQFEVRAGLQFVPLEKPRVVYLLDLEKDGKPSKLKLRADGTVVPPPVRPGQSRAYMGIAFEKNSTTIAQVTPGGPADQAGIKPGDKVLALGKAKVGTVGELVKALQPMKPGAEVSLQVRRGDKEMTFTVKLGTRPG